MKKFRRQIGREETELLKNSGIKISRSAIAAGQHRFFKENESLLEEARRETAVLRMKRFYEIKKWRWPPQKHPNVTIVHLINGYYGKEVCTHIPKNDWTK